MLLLLSHLIERGRGRTIADSARQGGSVPEHAAEPLRQAQRMTIGEFPHPFAWAAFGLTGVPR